MGDCEGLAGDEAGEVGAKVDDGVGDVLGVVAAAGGVLEGLAGVWLGGARAAGLCLTLVMMPGAGRP